MRAIEKNNMPNYLLIFFAVFNLVKPLATSTTTPPVTTSPMHPGNNSSTNSTAEPSISVSATAIPTTYNGTKNEALKAKNSTLNPCEGVDITNCLRLITDQMNRTEQMLNLANKTLQDKSVSTMTPNSSAVTMESKRGYHPRSLIRSFNLNAQRIFKRSVQGGSPLMDGFSVPADVDKNDQTQDRLPYPELEAGIEISDDPEGLKHLILDGDDDDNQGVLSPELQEKVKQALTKEHIEGDQRQASTIKALENLDNSLQLLDHYDEILRRKQEEMKETHNRRKRDTDTDFSSLLAQNQAQIQQLLQEQQRLLQQQQMSNQQFHVLSSAVKRAPSVLNSDESSMNSTDEATAQTNVSNTSTSSMTSTSPILTTESPLTPSLALNSSQPTARSTIGNILLQQNSRLNMSAAMSRNGSETTFNHTHGNSNINTFFNSILNSTNMRNNNQSQPILNQTNTTDQVIRVNPLLTQGFGNLSKTEQEEAELESAPEGLVLKVILQGQSKLKEGTLVDGNLTPVNASVVERIQQTVSTIKPVLGPINTTAKSTNASSNLSGRIHLQPVDDANAQEKPQNKEESIPQSSRVLLPINYQNPNYALHNPAQQYQPYFPYNNPQAQSDRVTQHEQQNLMKQDPDSERVRGQADDSFRNFNLNQNGRMQRPVSLLQPRQQYQWHMPQHTGQKVPSVLNGIHQSSQT